MRDQLRALENQLVLVTGRLVDKRRTPDGEHINVLVKPAVLHPWDGVSAVDIDSPTAGNGIPVDHLWFRMEPDQAKSVEMLQTCILCGKVGYYTRGSNGSVDLGVRSEPLVDLDRLMDAALDDANDKSVALLDRMKGTRETALTALYYLVYQGKTGWAFSRELNAREAVREIAQIYRKVDRSITATEARLATAPANGPCTRMKAADPFASLRRRGRKQGVAA
jgi:hypothetical protein